MVDDTHNLKHKDMPIEVRELIIKSTVVPEGGAGGGELHRVAAELPVRAIMILRRLRS